MGLIIAKFRKKPSTFDVLSKLENEIVSVEEFQKRTRQTQRKIVFRFVILAVLIYVILLSILYLYSHQISQNQMLLWITPLITLPLIIAWLIKKLLTWYYNRKLRRNEKKLVTLKERKKEILENVMETETYKVAKKILDKFGNDSRKPPPPTPQIQTATPLLPTSTRIGPTALRQRNITTLQGRASFGGSPRTPQRLLALPAPESQRSIALKTPGVPVETSPLPRSILPRDRSILDKMVEYLVGDGPSNRFALICHKCCSHNGMALKEEFEYLAFNCCYCNTFNPARKKRPMGPKFESPSVSPAQTSSHAESSDSERNSENDSDSETRPIVEEPRTDSPDTAKTSDFERVSESELMGDDLQMEIDSSQSQQDTARITDLNESGDTVEDSKKAERESYDDRAQGYVQLYRASNVRTVKGKICPEQLHDTPEEIPLSGENECENKETWPISQIIRPQIIAPSNKYVPEEAQNSVCTVIDGIIDTDTGFFQPETIENISLLVEKNYESKETSPISQITMPDITDDPNDGHEPAEYQYNNNHVINGIIDYDTTGFQSDIPEEIPLSVETKGEYRETSPVRQIIMSHIIKKRGRPSGADLTIIGLKKTCLLKANKGK